MEAAASSKNLDKGSSYNDAAMHQPFKLTRYYPSTLFTDREFMAMIIDGARNTGAASLRLTVRPGCKYFTRDTSGSFRVKTKGVWVSYCQHVYNVSTQEEECREIVEVGDWRQKAKVTVEPIFIPEDYLSYISLSGNYLLEGLEIEKVVYSDKLIKVKLDLEDIIVDTEGQIKSIGRWNTDTNEAENFKKSGRYLKAKD